MTAREFRLYPFPGTAPRFPLEITGTITRRDHTLVLRYELRGDLEALSLPGPAAHPGRLDGLWQETCLEFFLAPPDSPRYWEFNLSPAGHWNVYRFRDYRQGMTEAAAFTALPFSVLREPASLRLYRGDRSGRAHAGGSGPGRGGKRGNQAPASRDHLLGPDPPRPPARLSPAGGFYH